MGSKGFATSPRWDLDSLYAGGAGGHPIVKLMEDLNVGAKRLLKTFDGLAVPDGTPTLRDQWAKALLELEALDDQLEESWTMSGCWASEDVEDVKARLLLAKVDDLSALRRQVDVPIWSKLVQAKRDEVEALRARPDLRHMDTYLSEVIKQAEISMDPALERLNAELSNPGFNAWTRLYDTVSSSLQVHVDRGNGVEALSVEQAKHLLESTDADLRQRAARALHTVWGGQKETFAAALNALNGYRHVLYARKGIDEIEVPLRVNRISRPTLEAMFAAIDEFRPTLARFLAAKAKLLGVEKLRWFDVDVPLGKSGDSVSYDDAQDFIVEHFGRLSDDLGRFAQHAFTNHWIEAEDRPRKRQGGFCATVPLHQQTRIFMTFCNTPGSVQTLAHELGHAYHAWVLKDAPGRQRSYPAALAETASTFAESVIREAALEAATDAQVRLGMLDRKLADGVAFLMNIPARYRFERAMYAERGQGDLTTDRLSELMVAAWDHAYLGALGEPDHLFWAAKLHFYISDLPFYNFPYAFGFLFSMGLFARALEEGKAFAPHYDETLRLTGYLSCEEVAKRALGVDLSKPDFWQSALSIVAKDVDAFLAAAQ